MANTRFFRAFLVLSEKKLDCSHLSWGRSPEPGKKDTFGEGYESSELAGIFKGCRV